MPERPIQHIIWDWNGTLLDDAWLCVEIINGVLSSRGRPTVDLDSYRHCFGFPVCNYYRHLGLDSHAEPFEAVSHEFVQAYARRWNECELQPGAPETLAAAQAAGLTQSVLSASHQPALETAVSRFALRDYFVRLVGLDNVYAHGKLEQGRAWVQSLRCRPGEILLIGDTRHDYEVASELGLHCLLLSRGHHTRERLEACSCPVLDSLEALPELLEIPPGSDAWREHLSSFRRPLSS